MMQAQGKKVVGTEPNKDYAACCREELGTDVRTAHLDPGLLDAGSFDLVRLRHTLEHLGNPVKYLAMIREWLALDVVVCVGVPNIEEPCRVQTRGNKLRYGLIWNFNPWTLGAAASLVGLEELDATRMRSACTPNVVFRKGSVRAAADLVDTGNAARVRDLIARHYAGGFREVKAAEPPVYLAASRKWQAASSWARRGKSGRKSSAPCRLSFMGFKPPH